MLPNKFISILVTKSMSLTSISEKKSRIAPPTIQISASILFAKLKTV